MAMSHSKFAMQAAYLASRSASWAGECADNLGEPERQMRDDSVARFLAMVRETADRIEQMHTETS
jgi:hypothetical protein